MNDRLIEIEKKLAFQDDTIEHLSQVMIDQEKKIRDLEARMDSMQRLLSDERLVKPPDDEEPPPHY